MTDKTKTEMQAEIDDLKQLLDQWISDYEHANDRANLYSDQLGFLRDELDEIAHVGTDTPTAAHGSEEMFYRSQLMGCIKIATLALDALKVWS